MDSKVVLQVGDHIGSGLTKGGDNISAIGIIHCLILADRLCDLLNHTHELRRINLEMLTTDLNHLGLTLYLNQLAAMFDNNATLDDCGFGHHDGNLGLLSLDWWFDLPAWYEFVVVRHRRVSVLLYRQSIKLALEGKDHFEPFFKTDSLPDETGAKLEEGEIVGVDTGINKLASTNDGGQYGAEIKDHIERVKRCPHGSKGQKRARNALTPDRLDDSRPR